MSVIISGTQISLSVKNDIRTTVSMLKQKYGIVPSIATIIVGEDIASMMYVHKKKAEADKIGIKAEIIKLPIDITDEEIKKIINNLNRDREVHGILVQLPLPAHLDKFKVINYIDPAKDIDGLTTINAGYIATNNLNQISLIPCTPQGCITLVKSVCDDLTGKNVLIVGKSNLVGKPLSDLLLHLGCTVTTAHKATTNLDQHAKNADIIFVATGSHGVITGDMIHKNSILIDIGISKVDNKIVGDCDFDSCQTIAKFITPVPGGVGPMTITYLLYNSIICVAQSKTWLSEELKPLTSKWGFSQQLPNIA